MASDVHTLEHAIRLLNMLGLTFERVTRDVVDLTSEEDLPWRRLVAGPNITVYFSIKRQCHG